MRTLKDFVHDMVGRGKKYKQIRAVASLTRWKSQIHEIKPLLKEMRNK